MFENSSLKFLDEFSNKVCVQKLVIEIFGRVFVQGSCSKTRHCNFWTSFRTRFVFENSSLKFWDEFLNKVCVRKLVIEILGRVFEKGLCSKTRH